MDARIRRGILVHPQELDERWISDAAEAGLNVLGLHPPGGTQAAEALQQAIRLHGTDGFQKLLDRARSAGLAVEYEAHALGWLLPREQFGAHPDWFRMDETGARNPDCNLCPSNREALDFLADRTETLTRALDTGSDRVFWWCDDAEGKRCLCPRCRELSASDQQARIVRAIHAGARRAKPGVKTAYLAYLDTLTPPAREELPEGVFLEFAPFRRDVHRPLHDPDCPVNDDQARALRGLLTVFDARDAQVLDYWMDNSMFSHWTKPPRAMSLDTEAMAADVRFYRSLGIGSITSFGCFLGADYRALYGQPPIAEYGRIIRQGE